MVSKIDKAKAEVELQNYFKHYKEQESMLTQLQDKSTQQHMVILQKEKELKDLKSSMNSVEAKAQVLAKQMENEYRKEADSLRKELTKQKTENQLMLREKLEKAKKEHADELTREKSLLQEQIQHEREKVQSLEKKRGKKPDRAKRDLNLMEFRRWDAADVYYWLCEKDNGRLEEWAELLFAQDISGDLLTELNGEDLTQMGIEALGARKAILKHISQLRRASNQSLSVASYDTYDSRMDDSFYGRDSQNDVSEIIPFHDSMTPKHRKMLTNKSISIVEEYNPQLALMQKQILTNPDIIADPRFLQSFMSAYSSSQLSLGNLPQLSSLYGGSTNNLSVKARSSSGASGTSLNVSIGGASMGALESLKEDKEEITSPVSPMSPVTVTITNLDESKSTQAEANEDESHFRDVSHHSDQSHTNTQSRSSEDNNNTNNPHIKTPSENSNTNTNTKEDLLVVDDDELEDELTDIEKYETLKRDALNRLNELRGAGQTSPRSRTTTFDDGMLSDNEDGDANDLDRILRPVPDMIDPGMSSVVEKDDENDGDDDEDDDDEDDEDEEQYKIKIEEKLKMMDELIKSKFNKESDADDSDSEMELDYEETWLDEDHEKSFNVCLLSPYKRLRKAMVRFCFDEQSIDERMRTAAYKKYEKRNLQCGDTQFTFRMIEIYDPTYIGEMFDKQQIDCVWIVYPFDVSPENIPRKEEIFLEGLEDWVANTPHWQTFWEKTVRMLDHSLDFKHSKNVKIKSIDDYFTHYRARIQELQDLYVDFNIPGINNPELKWLPIDTNVKCKFKDKTIKPHKKFKWPNIPVTDGGLGQDWKVQLYLKLLQQLKEPYRSYFMVSAMSTPKKNLVAKPFESEFKRTVEQGVSLHERKNTLPVAVHKKKKSRSHNRKHSKHSKHHHKKSKSKKSNDFVDEEDKYLNKYQPGKELKSVFADQPSLDAENETNEKDDKKSKDKDKDKEKKHRKSKSRGRSKSRHKKHKKKDKKSKKDDDGDEKEIEKNNEQNSNEEIENDKEEKEQEKEKEKEKDKENENKNLDVGLKPQDRKPRPLKQSLSREIDIKQVESLLDESNEILKDDDGVVDENNAGDNDNVEKQNNNNNINYVFKDSNAAPQLDMFVVENEDLDYDDAEVTPPAGVPGGDNEDSPTPPAENTPFNRLFGDVDNDSDNIGVAALSNHASNTNQNINNIHNINDINSSNLNLNDRMRSLSGSPREIQPSWAYSNVNAAMNAYGMYNNYYSSPFSQGINVYTPQMTATNSSVNNFDDDNGFDSDDGLDEELDFLKQTSSMDNIDGTQTWKFNRKYAQQNRKQSIQRMEDLIQGADKTIAALQNVAKPTLLVSDAEDDSANFKLDSDNLKDGRRMSKYDAYRDHKNTYLSGMFVCLFVYFCNHCHRVLSFIAFCYVGG